MPNLETTDFKPTEVWDLDDEIDEPTEKALYEMNQKTPKALIHNLEQKVTTYEGVTYAVLQGNGPDQYSHTDALVIFNPFANAATANMLVRAEFVREVAKYNDVRDEMGKLKPVIMLASPGIHGSQLRLTAEERHQVRDGKLGPAAEKLLCAVTAKGFGRAALLGWSQGADMALAGADVTYGANLDIHAVGVGDPAAVEDRNTLQLGVDFFEAGSKDLNKSVESSGIEAQKLALGTKDFINFGLSSLYPINLSLFKGLAKDQFEKRMQVVLDNDAVQKIVIAYGADSAISRPSAIEPKLQRLHTEDYDSRLVSIRFEGGGRANHTVGDRLTVLARLFIEAVA
jgi:hypothetical protein